jgi:hypothetical protein
MALAEEVTRVVFAGSGTDAPFPLQVGGVPLTYASRAHLTLTRFDSDDVPTVLGLDDYVLSADSVLPPVGTAYPQTVSAADVTLTVDLEIGEHLVVERSWPRTQEQVLTNGGGFSSASNERAYDAIVRQIQELSTQLDRALIVHPLDDQGALALDLAADDRDETKILGFDADGNLAVVDRPQDGATGATGATGPTGPTGPLGSGSGDVLGPATHADEGFPVWNGVNTRTLKDRTAAQMRTLLGLGSAALVATSALFSVANNLSEGTASTMRTNLGLGTAALLTSAQVFQPANNLSEAGATPATMRTNLGLGSAALLAEGTTAEYRAATADKVLTSDLVWAAGAHVALSDTATVAIDMSLGLNFSLGLGLGNRTLGNPTNPKVGQCGVIVITQGATPRTLAYASNWKFANGTALALSTAANAVDLLHYEILSATAIFGTLIKNVGPL